MPAALEALEEGKAASRSRQRARPLVSAHARVSEPRPPRPRSPAPALRLASAASRPAAASHVAMRIALAPRLPASAAVSSTTLRSRTRTARGEQTSASEASNGVGDASAAGSAPTRRHVTWYAWAPSAPQRSALLPPAASDSSESPLATTVGAAAAAAAAGGVSSREHKAACSRDVEQRARRAASGPLPMRHSRPEAATRIDQWVRTHAQQTRQWGGWLQRLRRACCPRRPHPLALQSATGPPPARMRPARLRGSAAALRRPLGRRAAPRRPPQPLRPPQAWCCPAAQRT